MSWCSHLNIWTKLRIFMKFDMNIYEFRSILALLSAQLWKNSVNLCIKNKYLFVEIFVDGTVTSYRPWLTFTWRGFYLKNILPYRLYLGFPWMDFLENLYLALPTHALQTLQASFPSLKIKGTLLEEKYAFSAVSWLPLEQFSWKCIPRTHHLCPINDTIWLRFIIN